MDLKLISLSNNKISRLFHDRIAKVLPKLISNNQVGFVKGKSISKNMILAQEII